MLTGTTTARPADCGACGRTFPTLDEVFSHPCDGVAGWLAARGSTLDDFRPTTNRADSLDAPTRTENTGQRPTGGRAPMSNRYPGDCARCGQRVEAGEGHAVKNHAGGRGASWAVEHKISDCPAVGTPAQATPAVEATAPTPNAGPPMTPPQEKFLRDLIAERETAQPMDADETVAAINTLPNPKLGASTIINGLLALPKRTAPVVDDNPVNDDRPTYTPEKGDVHVLDGDFYRIHKGQRSGRLYACQWDGTGWEFAGGALRKLSAATMATAEDAARFGEMYHACVFCTRPLDTPESTAVGYGPVCAAKRGLPWG